MNKIVFFALIDLLIFFRMFSVNNDQFETVSNFLFRSLQYTLIIDMCVYVVRYKRLLSETHEMNVMQFCQMILHMTLITNLVYAYTYIYSSDEQHAKIRQDLEVFRELYSMVFIRVILYVILAVVAIIFSP